MSDSEILLLSWTQLEAILALDPDQDEYASARAEITASLEEQFAITNPQLQSRSVADYTVSYEEHGEQKIIRFLLEEVEELV